MRPRIAVDASPAARVHPTGTNIYARELCRRLASVDALDWTFYAASAGAPFGPDVTVLPFPALRTQIRLPFELRATRPRLFFSPAHQLPVWCPVPALTVVHGLEFRRFPSAYSQTRRAALEASLRLAIRHCRLLITVSDASKRDLVELAGVAAERIRVVYPGAGDESPEATTASAEDLGIRKPFVLQVGRIEKRKNQLTSLRAVERIDGLTLVAIGPPADPRVVSELDASPRCARLDWVEPAVRDALYREAAAFVFPSLYEGFGLPIVEAMRLGSPVVTARNSSLPEAGGEAAVYVDDPLDTEALAAALREVVFDEPKRAAMIAAGRRQAERFSWDRCAREVVDVIRELL